MAAPADNVDLEPPLSDDELNLRERLRGHVELLAGIIGVRHDSRPSSLEATISYLTRQWEEMGQAVESQTYPTGAGDATNLVVEWPGESRPDEIVVVGAHYDTVKYTPGADDNASAVAALLEVCRGLKGQRFEQTLRFVAFANEEPPHFPGPTMGSAVYAGRCREADEQIAVMVCLEMLGYFDTSPDSQTYPDELPALLRRVLPTRGDFIAFVSDVATRKPLGTFTKAFKKAVRFPVQSVPLPKAKSLLWVSDHGPFWDHGYPALMVTDTSYFRNPHYHEPTDLPDTLDFDRFARLTRGLIEAVAAVAEPVKR